MRSCLAPVTCCRLGSESGVNVVGEGVKEA
jgi:hypothetical protein